MPKRDNSCRSCAAQGWGQIWWLGAQANAEVRAAGMVVNTMGWVDGLGYELLLHAIGALRADVVLVVGQDRLFSQLSAELRCAPRDVAGRTRTGC